MKKIITPSGRAFKFGRKPRIVRGPRLSLKRYLLPTGLPPVPSSCDFSRLAAPVLADIFQNDSLGDCVIAGGYHVVGLATGNAGNIFHATTAQILADYSAIGGYVPGDESTDNGCDEQTALSYWSETGFADGTKAAGWVAVNPNDKQEVMAAQWLFENLFFGVSLPDGWINPFPEAPGFTWDVAGDADPNNGHCFVGCGFDTNGVKIDTWGMLGTLTWAALQEYCSEANGGALYSILTPDQIAKGQMTAPNGIDWGTLARDLEIIKG